MVAYLTAGFDSFYELCWVFLIYAFFGWCAEVAYSAVTKGVFVNRGFLNGPVCPIYGVGMIMVVSCLTPLKGNHIVLFLGSMFLTTAVELFVGWGMEKVFHQHWWDYSDEHFNFRGYICLRFSLIWGFGCMSVIDIAHPPIKKIISIFPYKPGVILQIFFFAVFITDIVITIMAVLKFNKHLVIIDEIDARLDMISEAIGENIYEGATGVKEKVIKVREAADEQKKNLIEANDERIERLKVEREELNKKIRAATEARNAVMCRLVKAFPAIKSTTHERAMDGCKKALEKMPKLPKRKE
ncbi:MAG: hypothetical protein K6E39_06830 [Lachnospiraceae bacterium]|nr:hypothetical protein [Lachnospiraceae bacterium]